jgi:hypothetical protein
MASLAAPSIPLNVRVPVWSGEPRGVTAESFIAARADPVHLRLARAVLSRAVGEQRQDLLLEIQRAAPAVLTLNTKSALTAFRILRSGIVLNGYERFLLLNWDDADYSGLSAMERYIALAGAYKQWLDEWGQSRLHVERTLRFGPDCRYLAASWTGRGVPHYGPISLQFRVPDERLTFFDGDSAEIAGRLGQTKTPENIIRRSCTRSGLPNMLLARHSATIARMSSPLNLDHLDAALANNPEIIEAHLHGPLSTDHLRRIRFARSYVEGMRVQLREAVARGISRLGPSTPRSAGEEFDELYYFLILQRLCERRGLLR